MPENKNPQTGVCGGPIGAPHGEAAPYINPGSESVKEDSPETRAALFVDGFNGARTDAYDHGYILSADSDQVATALWMQKAFPQKKLTMVVPPGRIASKEIRDRTKLPSIQLTKLHLERCLLPPFLTNGSVGIKRPFEYAPDPSWVHPSQRP